MQEVGSQCEREETSYFVVLIFQEGKYEELQMSLLEFESDVLSTTRINENNLAHIPHQILVVFVSNQTIVPKSLELDIDILGGETKLRIFQQEKENIFQKFCLLIRIKFAELNKFLKFIGDVHSLIKSLSFFQASFEDLDLFIYEFGEL